MATFLICICFPTQVCEEYQGTYQGREVRVMRLHLRIRYIDQDARQWLLPRGLRFRSPQYGVWRCPVGCLWSSGLNFEGIGQRGGRLRAGRSAEQAQHILLHTALIELEAHCSESLCIANLMSLESHDLHAIALSSRDTA